MSEPGRLFLSGKFYRRHGKRLLDLTLAFPALALLSPVGALVALLVHLRLGASVLFRQQRPGLHGRPFTLYKFHSMTRPFAPPGARSTTPGVAYL